MSLSAGSCPTRRLRRYEIAISGARNNAPTGAEEASEPLGASMANRASPAGARAARVGVNRTPSTRARDVGYYLRPLFLLDTFIGALVRHICSVQQRLEQLDARLFLVR